MRVRGSRKLRLAPLWPALAAVVVMTAALAWQLPPLLRATAGELLLDTLTLVDRSLAPALGGDPARVQRAASRLAAGTGLRVTVVAPDGRVLADSDRTAGEVARMENHASRPEVAAALAGGRGLDARQSATTQRRYVYAARVFPTAAGGRYVLRLAQPLDDLALVRSRLLAAVAASLLVTLVAILVLSLWLDRRLLRPLAGLIAGTSELAAGRRRERLPVPDDEDLAGLATAVNRLSERAEARVDAVAAERDDLQAIVSAMSEGVLVVDGEGRAVLANPAFRRLFALPPGEVAGRRPLELVRRPELADVVAEALAGGPARRDEVTIDSPGPGGAAPRTLSLAGAPLGLPDPERPGAVIVARDTSEVVRLARVRSDFVANVSHELKTPLAAIRGLAETLRDGAVDEPETARGFLDRLLDQCRRLQLLLDDLLTLSRLESPEAAARERRPVALGPVVERAVETVAPRAADRRVELNVAAAPGLPPVLGDAEALERLVSNLVDNAVKYNRPGGAVTVELAAGVPAPGGGTGAPPADIVLTVADTGLGIPAHARDRIFERFYRVDRGRARDEGGTGLGLAIVKHVAQSHGGTIEVESRPGEGSLFRVRLPASAAASPEEPGRP